MDATPAVPVDVTANRPPSGEMAMPRLDPTTAREVMPPEADAVVAPFLTTPTPVYEAV